MRFDYSQFHPLDHFAASPTCFGWYGGPWRHMELWLQYQFQFPFEHQVKRRLFCRRGNHELIAYWTGQPPTDDRAPDGASCAHCEHSVSFHRRAGDPGDDLLVLQ